MEVHRQLGPGFREAVYKDALEIEFGIHGIPFMREFAFPVVYKGKPMRRKYPCDFLVFDEIILELKAATALVPEHEAQVINYLRSANKKLGLLINFGTMSLQFKRLIN